MRILMLVHSLRRGGAERVLLELALGLQMRGHVVEVVSWLDIDEYKDERYRLITRHYLVPKSDYRWIRTIPNSAVLLSKIARELKPDVVQIHTPNIVWLAAWANYPAPYVHVLHGYGNIARLHGIRSIIIRLGSCLAAQRIATRLVVVSKSMIPIAASYYRIDASRIRSIPNGVDMEKYKPNIEPNEAGPTILMVGTLNSNKGQTLGLSAFQKL